MADIFSSKPGFVVAVAGPAAPPIQVAVEGLKGTFGLTGILTAISLSPQVNVQFQHSLDNYIHAYVLGNRMGEMVVSGLMFAGACAEDLDETGWDAAQIFWRDNKASERPLPLQIAIGIESAYDGFLTSGHFALDDPDRGLGKFAFKIMVVP